MITKQTCERIWHCYREIEAGEELIKNVNYHIQKNEEYIKINTLSAEVKDTFGGNKGIEMAVPCNESGSSKSIYRVSPELALSVIKAHIANKKAELAELHEISKIQLADS